jgi:hypothetical protein
MRRSILVMAPMGLLALMAAPVLADEVILKGGGKISGEIISQDANSVTVDIGAGTMAVQMSSVVRIDKTTSPLQEYRNRAAKLGANDVEGWRELARWADHQILVTQAREAWTKVTQISPGDPEAHRELGQVEYNGQWVSEEESFKAQGFIKFEGEWMTPGERDSIVSNRDAADAAESAALDANIQAQNAAAAERLAQKQAEDDEFWAGVPTYGDPLYYDSWGVAPMYWPSVPGRDLTGRGPNRPAQLPARTGGRIR